MTEEQLEKILQKVPTDKAYEDLLQPALRKVGEALADVFDLSNLILLPFKMINGKTKLYLQKNLELYQQKLNKIPENDFCKVPVQIGLPILDKLSVITQNEISEAFINLLTKASSSSNIHCVHPAYINILGNLSQDEAIILFAFKNFDFIPFIDVYIEKETSLIPKPKELDKGNPFSHEVLEYQKGLNYASIKTAYNLTGLENKMKLYFPKNIDIYIENLERLGIISFTRELYHRDKEMVYVEFETNTYKKIIDDIRSEAEKISNELTNCVVNVKRGYIEFTEFGKSFMNAAIKDIEYNANNQKDI